MVSKWHPHISEPEERFVVSEEEIHGGHVFNRWARIEKFANMLEVIMNGIL